MSNSSDDLLQVVAASYPHLAQLRFLRRLPVHFDQASQRVIAAIEAHDPDIVLCCGMGELRHALGLESTAVKDEHVLQSPLPLAALRQGLAATEISHDAGRFVCNRLYYDVLNHLRNTSRPLALFIHVPKLTPHNCKAIATDFMQVLDRLRSGQLSYLLQNQPSALPAIPVHSGTADIRREASTAG